VGEVYLGLWSGLISAGPVVKLMPAARKQAIRNATIAEQRQHFPGIGRARHAGKLDKSLFVQYALSPLIKCI
jgi:hypothetical protein